jgi:hypothetical protein
MILRQLLHHDPIAASYVFGWGAKAWPPCATQLMSLSSIFGLPRTPE